MSFGKFQGSRKLFKNARYFQSSEVNENEFIINDSDAGINIHGDSHETLSVNNTRPVFIIF